MVRRILLTWLALTFLLASVPGCGGPVTSGKSATPADGKGNQVGPATATGKAHMLK